VKGLAKTMSDAQLFLESTLTAALPAPGSPVDPSQLPSSAAQEAMLEMHRTWLSRCTQVCEEAAKGNLEMRLLHAGQCGDFSPLMHSINHLLDMTDAFMRESYATLEHAGQGKFYRRVLLRGMLGSFRTSSKLTNEATAAMSTNAAKLQESEQQRAHIAEEFEGNVKKVVAALSNSADQVKQTATHLSQAAGDTIDDKKEAGGNPRKSGKEKERAQDLNTVVASLGEASQKIGGVVKLISQIAAQTNLLALNATIEAARAGEAGKGFAVVASEVKSLARQTTEATGGISREISAMRETAARTAELVGGMSATIHSMTQISGQLSQHAEELAGAVDSFLQNIRG
jgi:methyl-accepting chemotaxis protein